MSTQNKATSKRRTVVTLLSAGAVIVALGVWALAFPTGGGGGGAAPTFAVEQGPLTISVTEAGTIQALEQLILKSEVEGQTTIIYLIPEGTLVEEGELLVELDSSTLEDNLVDQKIRVQNAEAAFIQARENLKVTENQAKSDISKAKLDYDFAQEDLTKYLEGEYPKQVKEAETKITLADDEAKRAQEKYAWSQRLFEEKYISETELEADRLTKRRSELDYELAVDELDLLRDYTHKRQVAQLKSDIEQAELALERVQLKAKADIVQAEANLKAKEAELRQQEAKLAKVERQIKNTKIYAPRAGLVVYATSAKSSWRGNDEPLDEGQSVREREELIYLPTAEEMLAQVQIHESNLEKIRIGLPARITVDALQGSSYIGHVSKIAPLPNAHAMRMNPDVKVYLTEITLEGRNPELRTGMSCEAEVVVEQLEDAVYVPVQSVVRTGNQHMVYVQRGREFVPQPVKIGLDNNRMVHVKSGLAAGEVVSLTPPLQSGAVALGSDDPEEQAEREQFQEAIERAKQAPAAGRGGPRAVQGDANQPQAAQQPGGFPQMTDEQREQMREMWENMTPEQKEEAQKRMEEMRKRFENMTPEQRKQWEEQMQRGRGGQGGSQGGSQGAGGQRGGRGGAGGGGRGS